MVCDPCQGPNYKVIHLKGKFVGSDIYIKCTSEFQAQQIVRLMRHFFDPDDDATLNLMMKWRDENREV